MHINLPEITREQILAVARKRGLSARGVVIYAVDEMYQREIGEPERDLAAELDALRAEIERLKGGS